jgi:alkylated DNA repair dioxygenase AlkB
MADEFVDIPGEILWDNGRSQVVAYPDFLHLDVTELFRPEDLETNPPITIRGVQCHQNRDVGFFSDTSEGYRYSGTLARSRPLTPGLRKVLETVNEALGTNFNGILVNRYKNGRDCLGAHSDDARGLDPHNHTVASISAGAARKFRFRDKTTKKIVLDYIHQPGTLLVMQGHAQDDLTHEIPQEARVTEVRVSFTFRRHVK